MTEELLVFRGSLIVTAVIRTYRPGEEKYVADLHERRYAEEYGWGPALVTYAKETALEFPRRPENGRVGLWIAAVEGEPAGSVMLCETDDPSPAGDRACSDGGAPRQGAGGRVQNADPVDGGTARSGHLTVRALRLRFEDDVGLRLDDCRVRQGRRAPRPLQRVGYRGCVAPDGCGSLLGVFRGSAP